MTYPYVGPVAHDSGNGNLPVIRVVVHCTAGGADATGASGTARYFRMEEATGSAHAIADNDETLTCAYDTVVCWHAPPNPHSLGIELCCTLSNQGKGHWALANHVAMMKRGAKWVAEKCIKHKIPVRKLTVAQVRAGYKGICGHGDVTLAFGQSSHTDPERYFPWDQFMGFVQDAYDAILSPAPTPQPEEDMALTEAEWVKMDALVDKSISDYFIRFWTAASGTGTALIDSVHNIAAMQLVLAQKMNDLSKQTSDEDAVDDAAFNAAMASLGSSLDGLKTSVNQLKADVEAPTLPKA
jgi:hypothetical protein